MLPETIQMVPEVVPSIGNLVSVLGSTAGAALVANGLIPRINEKNVGLRVVGGRAVHLNNSRKHKAGELYSADVIFPGAHFIIPYFWGMRTVSLQHQRTDLDMVRAQKMEGENTPPWITELVAKLQWHVVPYMDEKGNDISDSYEVPYARMIYRAIFNADEASGGLPGAVNSIAAGSLRDILVDIGPSAVEMHQEEIFTLLQKSRAPELLLGQYAVQMQDLYISSLSQNGDSVIAAAIAAQSENDSNNGRIVPFKVRP